ncbi:MAG: hypothetical protein KF779_10800 [Hyphomonadaceae bacterium]|nr:hypothetical protein [Hyphomonadaceae bacterium]
MPDGTPNFSPASRPRRLGILAAFRNTDAHTTFYEDEFVQLFIPKGWGMQQLRNRVHAEVDRRKFEVEDRAAVQERMKDYFHHKIEMFEDAGQPPRLPDSPCIGEAWRYMSTFLAIGLFSIVGFLVWLAIWSNTIWLIGPALALSLGSILAFAFATMLMRQFSNKGRWPGLMEDRIGATIDKKFPDDADVRYVIDRYIEVFLDNNWMYGRLKRVFQTGAILCFYAGLTPLLYLAMAEPARLNVATLGGAGAAAAIVVVITLIAYYGLSDHIFEDKYFQSLKNSTQDISRVIQNRMMSITVLYKHFDTHIAELQATGEEYLSDKPLQQAEDLDLKPYVAFFDTQMLIWLAKRLEYIEFHLFNKLHSALTIHSFLRVSGLVATLSILIVGLLPAVVLGLHGLAELSRADGWNATALAASVKIGSAMALVVAASVVSYLSYFNRAWTSLNGMGARRSIIEEHFDAENLEGWQTFEKLAIDVNLAGQCQRAMIRIRTFFERLGFGGGKQ